MNGLAILDSVDSSNLPRREKSAIARFFEGKISPHARATFGRAKAHVGAGGTALMSGAVSGLVGGGLGYAHATLKEGLDIPVGATNHVPLDGLVALAGLGGYVLMPSEDFSSTLCRAGGTALGILAFRKTHDYVETRKGASSPTTTPVHGEDPVSAIGAMLGIR
jgi:hypothetical protein